MKSAVATQAQTIDALLKRSGRRNRELPLRRSFVQQRVDGVWGEPPLAKLVSAHAETALRLYLLAHALASNEPYAVELQAGVWARALGLGAAGTTTVSKAWAKLAQLNLVSREKRGRLSRVKILREDGSGEPYTHPADRHEPYMKLSYEYWTAAWDQKLSLAAKAVLLIALGLPDNFSLPRRPGQQWYSISADTLDKGLGELCRLQVLVDIRRDKLAPLTARGVVSEVRYRRQPPFRPKRVAGPAAHAIASDEEVVEKALTPF